MIRAPGSLFLSGEYAVLLGARAIVTAVDRYVTVTDVADETPYGVLGFDLTDLSLPHAVCEVLGIDRASLSGLRSDVTSFFSDGKKLGLSSSAASTVALCRALGSADIERDALAAHTLFQKKSGSGADIKLAARGGTWAVRAETINAPFFSAFSTVEEKMLSIPASLRIEAVWLGSPASTTRFVSSVASRLDRPVVVENLTELGELSEQMITNLASDDPLPIIQTVRSIDRVLGALGSNTETEIVIEAHRALRDAVPTTLAVKPSGAGGGDFSLVVGPVDANWDFGVEFADLQFDAPL